MMAPKKEKINLLSEIAYMYYLEGLSQNDIAQRLFISRSRVSRMLKEAGEMGLVEIKVNFVSERCTQLEHVLKKEFGLKDVRVYNDIGHGEQETFQAVCGYAAEYLNSHLKPNSVLGITRGAVLAEIVRGMKSKELLNLDVVQVMGQESAPNPELAAPDLIRKILAVYGGTPHYLNAPVYIENEHLKRALLSEPYISKTLEIGRNADFLLSGIGVLNSKEKFKTAAVWNGYVSEAVVDDLISLGGCGYMLGRAFDSNGVLLDHPLNRKIVGIEVADLKRIGTVMCVSSGEERSQAVEAALRAQYINVLITDRNCAEQVIKRHVQRQNRSTEET